MNISIKNLYWFSFTHRCVLGVTPDKDTNFFIGDPLDRTTPPPCSIKRIATGEVIIGTFLSAFIESVVIPV